MFDTIENLPPRTWILPNLDGEIWLLYDPNMGKKLTPREMATLEGYICDELGYHYVYYTSCGIAWEEYGPFEYPSDSEVVALNNLLALSLEG